MKTGFRYFRLSVIDEMAKNTFFGVYVVENQGLLLENNITYRLLY